MQYALFLMYVQHFLTHIIFFFHLPLVYTSYICIINLTKEMTKRVLKLFPFQRTVNFLSARYFKFQITLCQFYYDFCWIFECSILTIIFSSSHISTTPLFFEHLLKFTSYSTHTAWSYKYVQLLFLSERIYKMFLDGRSSYDKNIHNEIEYC